MDRLEEKIDALLEGQSKQALAINALQSTVSNGMRTEITRTMEMTKSLSDRLEKVCVSYDEKFKELDKFDWFRKMVNGFFYSLIGKVLLIVMAGGFMVGLVVLLWHAGLIKL